jgi:23S rRNA (uracil1939-C5)-methyltransferase
VDSARIAWLAPDGSGGGKTDDGRIVQVPGTIPGDVVTFEVVGKRGRTVLGQRVDLQTPSPGRRAPTCPVDAACGGCDLAVFGAGRTEALATNVARSVGWDGVVPVVTGRSELGTRARVKLALGDGVVGYHGARSHELVDVHACEIARPEVVEALGRLRTWWADAPFEASEVEIRSDGTRAVFAFRGRRPRDREIFAPLADVAVDGKAVYGDPTLRLPVAGLRLFASPTAFFQVHLELNEALVAYVGDRVREASPERVLDLYAGIGNLGLPLAASGIPVLAVERDGPAIADLERTAADHGIDRIRALALDARRFDPSREPYDVAVLDPPRAGAGDVLPRVLRNRPRRVVLVSCDVRAAGRDVRAAKKAGYRLTDVRCFDLFPRTHHLETVSVLDR